MKRRTLLRLSVSLLLIAAFVISATIVESGSSLNPQAWVWAQRQLPLLWIVDAFALVALVPVCGFAGAQNRLHRRAEETARTRDEHQVQLERMLGSAERSEQWNAEQADTIAALQQALATLAAKLEAVEQDGQTRQQTSEAYAQARQQALEAEARHLAEQAFASVNGQVEANTRQMEAVNLAMQYQRAEIKQLRQGVRVIQRHHEIFHVAQLSPDEQAAIASLENMDDIKYLADNGAGSAAQNGMKSIASSESGGGANNPSQAEPLPLLSAGAGEPGFFAPTMNGQATFVSSPTAYTVAAPSEANFLQEQQSEQQEQQEQQTAVEQTPARTNAAGPAPEETAANLHVTEEEYRWLTGTSAASPSDTASDDNTSDDNTPPDDAPRATGSPCAAPPAPQEPPASSPPARRWRLRL